MQKIFTLLFLFSTISITVECQTADFSYQSLNGLFCAPTSIQLTYTGTGSPTGYIWDFGNNSGSNASDPAVTYLQPGSYTIKLVATYDQVNLSVSKTIVINPSITATINVDRNYICTPGNINFTGSGNGNIATYQWDFGDGSAVISTSSSSISHNYSLYGSYYATLKATDINGCFGVTSKHIVLEHPQITAVVSPISGCIPATVNFQANVLLPVSGTVSEYSWDFNDGSPVSTTATNNTTHVYNTIGSYLPSLSIATNEGCTNTYSFSVISFGTPPTSHIAYPKKASICGSETADLVSKAVNANSYHWDFGDGNSAIVTDTIAHHRYYTLGTKTITVTPAFNGCQGTPISFSIDVVGVIANYTFSNTCSSLKQFGFINTSLGNLSTISWDFGDGSPTVNTFNTNHNFPLSGSFITILNISDNISGCVDQISETIYTADPSLSNTDSAVCKNNSTIFSILNNYNNPAAQYTWHVAGNLIGPRDSSNLSLAVNTLGNFISNYVVITNGPGYCPDTVQLPKPILVKGPNLSFISPDSICLKSSYSVINTSQPFIPSDTVRLWIWNFGVTANSDTIYQPLPYTQHPYPGTWDIQLTAIDKYGCKDSLHKILTVNPVPFIHSTPGIDTLCQGKIDTLIAFHSGNILWSPATLVSCNSCDTVLVNPTISTNFYVTATNNFNCSTKDSVFVKVFNPFTAIANPSDLFTCMNDPVQLNVSPTSKIVSWTPSSGLSNPNINNPVATPSVNTSYTALLVDSVGCFRSQNTVNVHIKSIPAVNAGIDRTYPYNSNFSFTPVYSNNVSTYLWTPSTLLSCGNCAIPNGVASTTQTYTITVTSDSGCIAKDEVTIYVECKDANLLLPGAFTPNNDNLNDYFYPLTRGIRQIVQFSIYNRMGQLVYERKNFDPNNRLYGWDGKLNGALQPATTYVYFIETICEAGNKLSKKGSFMLFR